MRPLRGWRLPLRLARRDALRHRGRSALTLVMVMLPVLGVTAADILAKTQSVSSVESLDRRLGHADARVTVQAGLGPIRQAADPDDGGYGSASNSNGNASKTLPTSGRISQALGGARLLELRDGEGPVGVRDGRTRVEETEVDLTDPLSRGLFRLTAGRWPHTPHQAVINAALAAKGYRIGDRLQLDGSGTTGSTGPVVVGIAESASVRTYPEAAGPLGTFGLDHDSTRTWLVGGGPVSWHRVQALNALGAIVVSRAVITNPPATADAGLGSSSQHEQTAEVVALIATMALIEVVLLAGPAFAVGARRQQRALALIAASGGTPAQARRVILGTAVVLGGVAAVAGVALGIGVARLFVPVLQAHADNYFGPFQIAWTHLLGIAAFGLLSAFLAAVVPAWIASRQDVVAVLAGRRGDQRLSRRSPILGVLLLALGLVGSASGAGGSSGELLIAASAIPTVLGMVLLIPLVLASLGSASRRLPLVLRYAVRDAARHRTRTVPAIAAVAATVAGVVALSIGLSSDQEEQRATYQPTLPHGMALVSSYDEKHWSELRAVVRQDLPDARISPVLGLSDTSADGSTVLVTATVTGRAPELLTSSGGSLGANVMVAGHSLPPGLVGVSDPGRASAALAAGRTVLFTDQQAPGPGEARLVAASSDSSGNTTGTKNATVPAEVVRVQPGWIGPSLILTTTAARALGVSATTVGLVVSGTTITSAEESATTDGVTGVSTNAGFYVERGFQPPDSDLIVQWILIGMGAVLMLGGTLTATFLALSDARPDLATLSAVGASPRTRRGVAAAYAVVVGLVGAVLGAIVGFVPGIAVTYPLTTTNANDGQHGPFIAIPWPTLAVLIVALPLATAVVVGLCARSRLPMVARME